MNVNKKSWHYKWYCWFKGDKYPTNTNLCPYARTVFFYTPLKFLFAKGLIGKIPIPAIIYPVLLFEVPRWLGMFSYDAKIAIYAIYIISGCIALAVGAALGIVSILRWIEDSHLRSKMSDEEWFEFINDGKKKKYLPHHLLEQTTENRILNWFDGIVGKIENSLLVNYIRSFHNKICPFITFED